VVVGCIASTVQPLSFRHWAAAHLDGMSEVYRRVSAVPRDNVPFFCSWSGGKDSCLALYRAMKAGATPRFLFTVLEESGERSRSHGLPREILQAQALSLGIPLKTRCASWSEYEAVFITALQEMAERGVRAGVFGDIDIDSHREWEEMVCHRAGMEAYLPLWNAPREVLLEELLTLGFEGSIIATRAKEMGKEYLGKNLDEALVEQFIALGIDPSGEAGEYHTVITNGPIFAQRLKIRKGEAVLRSGYWVLDIGLAG
jgi:diphthine-ammonia ligase